jgi:hypothetical protein
MAAMVVSGCDIPGEPDGRLRPSFPGPLLLNTGPAATDIDYRTGEG